MSTNLFNYHINIDTNNRVNMILMISDFKGHPFIKYNSVCVSKNYFKKMLSKYNMDDIVRKVRMDKIFSISFEFIGGQCLTEHVVTIFKDNYMYCISIEDKKKSMYVYFNSVGINRYNLISFLYNLKTLQ